MWKLFSNKEKKLSDRWDNLYRVAYACCHNPDLAADLVQDTLEKAMRKHHQINKPESMDSWLFTILFNCWRDYCRRNKYMVDIADVELVQHQTPLDDSEREVLIYRVQSAVMQLGIDQRQVVALVDLGGMSYNHVSEILGIPIGTVMSRLCRARKTLKKSLEDLSKKNESRSADLQVSSVRRVK